MKVKEVLQKKSPGVISIRPEQSLHEASKLLAKHKIGAVVVLDGDDAPVGILSERDIVRVLAESGAETLQRPVREAMTKDIISAVPDDDLASVSSTMTDHRIRHLPIMEDEALVGIVSIGDVVKAQLDQVEYEARMLRQYVSST